MSTIHAIYENGVFRPTGPVDLPEGAIVSIEPQHESEQIRAARERVYESLSRSYDGGDPHDAERHNEHRP